MDSIQNEIKSKITTEFNDNQEKLPKKEFQFTHGRRLGQRVFLKDIHVDEKTDERYLIFTDGTKSKESAIGVSLVHLPEGHPGYEFKKEVIEDLKKEKDAEGNIQLIPGPNHGKVKWNKRKIKQPKTEATSKKQLPAKPKPEDNKLTVTDSGNTIQSTEKTKPQQESNIEQNQEKTVTNDPIIDLLEKAKKHKKTYKIELQINSIDKNLYDIISKNYKKGSEKILDYLIDNLDIEEFKKEIKTKIKEIYEKPKKRRNTNASIQG